MPTKTRINGENYTQLPRIVSDDIILKGLPHTAGAPDGYGDLAETINEIYADSGIDDVKSLFPEDYADLQMFSFYENSLFGARTSASSQIVKVDSSDNSLSNYGNALPITGIRNIKPINSTTMLVEADGGTTIYKIYRTTDSGATWDLVLTAPFALIRMLTDRSICVADINGATVLLYGEYNVNGSRVAGSTNDAVRLLRSDDLGETWSEVTRWNTDGSTRNIRHIHCVKQDPVTKRIYVATGDSNSESAIYSWDGVTAWPVNVTPANLVQSAGLMVQTGAQRFRAVDIAFRDDEMYWMPDTNSGSAGYASEVGIWKCNTDFSALQLQRVSTCNSILTGHAGWLTVDAPDGSMLWCTGIDTPTSGFLYSAVISSNKALTDWKVVGAVRSQSTGNVTPYGFAAIDGKFYLSVSNTSGKAVDSTAVFSKSDLDFKWDLVTRYEPETLHPVYWVNPSTGSNSNDGYRPSTAFASVDYAATGDRATYGGRIQLPVGEYVYTGAAINPKINANARGGDPVEPCYITGYGASTTSLVFDSTASATIALSMLVNANSAVFGVKDLTTYAEGNIRMADTLGANTKLFVSRSVFGNCNFINPSLARSDSSKIYAYSSILQVSGSGITSANSGAANPVNVEGEKVAFVGGTDQIRMTTTTTTNTVRLVDASFLGFSSNAIESTGGDFSDFSIIDGQMKSAVSGAAALAGAMPGWAGKISSVDTGVSRGVATAFDQTCKVTTSEFNIDYKDYVY